MRTTELMIEAIKLYRQEKAERYLEEFWRLVERRRADLLNQAFVLLGNIEDAEDVVQETLRVTFSRLDSLRDLTALTRWMRAVNRKIALYVLRKRRLERKATKRLEAMRVGEESDGGGAPEAGEADAREAVMLAVDALPDPLREVVALRYLEGLSCEEMAERIGVPVGTIKSRMFRADKLLQRRLKGILRRTGGDAVPAGTRGPTSGAEAVRGEAVPTGGDIAPAGAAGQEGGPHESAD
ncbi:MAG: RNA polymerase sigma factor [Planctomycetota bacterium]|nr:RNA polymerase sigma factor [Planctomycetota bacterium]